jgi:DNA-binding PadR family transcriptional regulator
MIDLAILGVLRDDDLHGYELRKRIAELTGRSWAISFGSLYPALSRLERLDAVKAVEPAATARRAVPFTGSLAAEASVFFTRRREGAGRSGKSRKVYGITERGRQLLGELLDDPVDDDRAFDLKVAFCGELPRARRLELFERRRAQLASQLAGTRANRRRRTGERLDPYLRSLRDHDTASVEHDIAWLDRLIAAERAALDTPALDTSPVETQSSTARHDPPVPAAQEDNSR